MFKKSTWIVGLLAALAMMFVGCIDAPEVDNSGVETVVTQLSEVIKDAPVGEIVGDDAWTAIFGGTPFAKCGGSARFSIIEEGGKKKLRIDKMDQNWGMGLDVAYASRPDGTKGAGFKAGDVFYLKGNAEYDLFVNVGGEGFNKLENWNGTGDFDKSFTLDAATASTIKGNGKGIRLHFDGSTGKSRQGTLIFEEISVTGKRGAGDVEEPVPPPAPEYEVPTTYEVPAGDATSFYVNLNDFGTKGGLSSDILPTVNLTSTTAAVIFTANAQRVNFKFSGAQRNLLMDAGGVKVTIDATASNTSTTFRYTIGDATAGGGWNSSGTGSGYTTMVEGVLSSIIAETSAGWNANLKDAVNAGWFIIQARNTDVPCTVTITSIKIELLPGVAITSPLVVALDAPKAGYKAVTTVDTADISGDVEWYPALPKDGKFAISTVYYAKIVNMKAKPGKALPIITLASVTVGGIASYYDPGSRTITTGNFIRTDSTLPVLKLGKLFDMADWISGKSGSLVSPLSGTGNIGSGKITVTGIDNNWDCPQISLSGIDIMLLPELYKVRIEVTGKVLTLKDASVKGKIKFGGANNPWNEFGTTGELGEEDTFSMNALIPADWLTKGNGDIRIQSTGGAGGDNNKAFITSFEITGIKLTNEGAQ